MTVRVGIADDQEMVREGLRALLQRGGFDVVGEAVDGQDAIRLARRERPDVLLMDVRMPKLDGIEATAMITAEPALASVRVLIVTTFGLEEYVFGALRAGASGFIGKDADAGELRRAVEIIAAGQSLLDPNATRHLIDRALRGPGADPAARTRLAGLTPREFEVLRMVAKGLSNDEIARDLVISQATARTHVARAMIKTGVRDRAQLVILAYEAGEAGRR
ncbi:DNA-binding response regulator [Microlunatus endophyticus]|uniref:DNA-binding response regulator n=1 Tax=Microlunatus endophyticus TaxID=1716077 RepID=A0A917S584_9ACTN|nr:response regulator transcription factor [Microlunatus endophyticus]GGL59599.1 DNA-binding response regulator [Microlunatus endophyticus]